MTAMTDEEVRAFLERNEWNSGIKTDGRNLHYDDSEANAIYLRFPESPLRATYLARVAAMFGVEDEGLFYGALLWITLHTIGSPQLEKTGWSMIEMMRRGFGENRPLEAAAGHWFRDGAVVELAAFILPCFVFGWDAYVVPNSGSCFLHISHDEYWVVVTRDQEAYDSALKSLSELNPEVAHQGMLRQFCPRSKYISSEE